jgi:ornithine cyclodeaminase/alanine dehydrogenase-like protein (mu-crystallin family)
LIQKSSFNNHILYLAVGSFRATMRELADDLMLSSDTNVIVDSRESAMKEAGEIIQSKV